MSDIAFIGLGNMGLPMAVNLVKAGHSVTAFDMVPEAQEKAKAEGMTIAQSAAEAVAGADFVVTMLPNGAIVTKVYAEIVPAAKAGAVLIDCSTIDVASAKQAHAMCEKAGLLSLDAPVSGGTAGAAAGTLTFMVGGSREAFDRAGAILDVMGGKLVYCGEGGAGQSAKICNNMLLAISMIGACEAFALAEKIGLSAEAAFDVISTVVGLLLVRQQLLPGAGRGAEEPGRQRLQAGVRGGS